MEVLRVAVLKIMFHEFLGETNRPVRSFIFMGKPAVIFIMTSLLAVHTGMILVLADSMISFLIGFVRGSGVP
jgi:hypothetical protein